MAEERDVAALGRLIAARHGWPAAKAFKLYAPSDGDMEMIAARARDLLRAFPETQRDAAAMSAALAALLERHLDAPIQVVRGALLVDGAPAFGDTDPAAAHVWVMVGRYVADMAIFRLAYAPDAPPRLARHVARVFGEGRGMYVDRWRHTRRLGLDYVPDAVLSEAEVTALVGEAHRAIERPAVAPGA